ncbi:MAG: hypothetical protein WBG46_09020 [Nonlabens sp.]
METSKIVIGYLVYVPVMLALTFFVSRSLFKNGKVYMLKIFKGEEVIALSTNRLFEVGFYLLNIGFGLWILEVNAYGFSETYRELIEIFSSKIGGFAIYLGIMLFLNMFLFFRGMRKSKKSQTVVKTPIPNPNI